MFSFLFPVSGSRKTQSFTARNNKTMAASNEREEPSAEHLFKASRTYVTKGSSDKLLDAVRKMTLQELHNVASKGNAIIGPAIVAK
jgi:hypothetical protein